MSQLKGKIGRYLGNLKCDKMQCCGVLYSKGLMTLHKRTEIMEKQLQNLKNLLIKVIWQHLHFAVEWSKTENFQNCLSVVKTQRSTVYDE